MQIDTEMMAELLIVDRVFQPYEKLLVIDAMTGQEAVNVAENFDAQIGLTGLVLTKLDGIHAEVLRYLLFIVQVSQLN